MKKYFFATLTIGWILSGCSSELALPTPHLALTQILPEQIETPVALIADSQASFSSSKKLRMWMSAVLLSEVNSVAILACGLAWDFKFFEPIALSLRPSE